MGAAELDAAAGRGEITDAKTLVGLLWLQRWQAGAWPLVWLAPLSAPVLKPVDAPPVAALHNRAS